MQVGPEPTRPPVQEHLAERHSTAARSLPPVAEATTTLSLVLLVDFENVPAAWFSSHEFVRPWLTAIREDLPAAAIGDITVRLYGGWWANASVSIARQRAIELIEVVPALLEHENRYWRIHREFADNLLLTSPPKLAIRDTYVRRPVELLSLKPDGTQSCDRTDCQLKSCRAWFFRRRACTNRDCAIRFGDAWHRAEQKQVDVHLATDLLLIANSSSLMRHAAVASDDIDFVPAIAAAASTGRLSSLCHLRFQRTASYMDAALQIAGVKLVRSPTM